MQITDIYYYSCCSWQYSCTDLQTLLMQSPHHSIPVANDDDTVQPTYQIIGLGFYTTPGGTVATTSGFYVDEVSISSEKRNFAWENVRIFQIHFVYLENITVWIALQYLSPARPNGIALHEIITSAHITNDSDYINLTISMEIIPSSCDYDIPLINVTVIDGEATPGMSYATNFSLLCSNSKTNDFAWLH